jgi:hypothetical protein
MRQHEREIIFLIAQHKVFITGATEKRRKFTVVYRSLSISGCLKNLNSSSRELPYLQPIKQPKCDVMKKL